MGGVREVLEEALAAEVFPGAVAVVSRSGERVLEETLGTLAPAPGSPPAGPDTIYDLASITKVFTSTAVLTLVDRGLVEMDDEIGRFLPELPADKTELTVRELLAHTAGLPRGDGMVLRHRTPASLRSALVSLPLSSRPGRRVRYSSVGYIYLGWMIEAVAGCPLDRYLAEAVLDPCGLDETRFTPPAGWRSRIAPLEYSKIPVRVLHGTVYDAKAQVLGGVTGHAGLFAPAGDVLRFGEALLDPDHPVLGASRRLLFTDQTGGMLEGLRQRRSAGFVIDDPACAGAGRTTFSHTGFTGTSLCLVPELGTVVVLLTNRINPIREDTRIAGARRAFHRALWSGPFQSRGRPLD
jgi:CubicO group peptidase (beta-lactamase class C family)